MHIPDGYLGPQTYGAAYAVMAPVWAIASRIVSRTLRSRQAPMLALGAAFSFVIMMFNIPIPGGTSGHAVGAVLVAVLLGPWAACIAVSVALVVQAVLFSDGGITAIGANCLNMAVIMPFAGYGVYRLVSARSEVTSSRRWIGAALGGYIGLNAGALAAAFEFGIQPALAHDAAGRALYAPYPLAIAVPAMMLPHLLVFGLAEAAVTGMVVAYLQRTDLSLLWAAPARGLETCRARASSRLWIALLALILLSPLGLIVPAWFAGGTAWGEWSAQELHRLIGYAPAGMTRLAERWRAPLPDYALRGHEGAGLWVSSAAYIASALAGAAAVAALAILMARLLAPREMTRRRGLFVRRALAALGEALARELSAAQAPAKSWLARIEPRVKVVSVVILIAAVTMVQQPVILAGLFAGIAAIALSAGIGARRLARLWLGVPLFSLAIILPAALNLVTEGPSLFTICRFGPGAHVGPWALPAVIAVTRPGAVIAVRFLLRAVDCVSLAFVLAATTDSPVLLNALRRLGMPKAFGMALAMMQRYLAVLLRAAEQIHLAKLSRSIAAGDLRHEQRWVAAGMGSLFRRTRRLAEQVHNAMLSRGYDGDVQIGGSAILRVRDGLWLIVAIVFAVAVVVADRMW
jgi:cobalt/nickel transport system permease protein